MLSPLQERVARIVAGLAESDGFALAGGAALILRGDVDRRTRDLDFFGPDAVAVDRLVPVAQQALLDDGLRVQQVIDHPGFARLLVGDDNDQTEVDLGTDARLFPPEELLGIRVLSGEKLAVDKLLALFGRAEARDFVDLLAVADRYGLDRLLDLAAEKDRGFDARVFAEMLTRIDRLPKAAFALDDTQFERLQATIRAWKELALAYARRERGRSGDWRTPTHRPDRRTGSEGPR
ncbi:MAG: nucleotidyl transferase AbiEii/AbiGii toxin family protein [Actinomycetota bacterium]|nr:nucleotidyl transferase AbiEii/AbiGii toxin family protein [Actinomycetota bacterium]